jgi:phthalate 4,5-dioxygenase reductase subunit
LEALNPDLVVTLRVASATDVAEGIRQFELVDADGAALPEFTAGAHVLVQAPSGVTRRYSLCSRAPRASEDREGCSSESA